MKTTIEVGGFEIKIEEIDGKVTVVAEQDGEVIEQFELETSGEELAGEEGEDMMPFGDDEEEEFEQAQEEDEEGEGKLESFNSFIKKRNK
jgi:hypothetical protein